MSKTILGVIFGGKSSENSVSVISASSVLKNVNRDKYDLLLIGIDRQGNWYHVPENFEAIENNTWMDLEETCPTTLSTSEKFKGFIDLKDDGTYALNKVDVIFPVLHGLNGEDGTVQGLFELAGIPYVGCRVFASSACMDKIYTKKVLSTAGIPQVNSLFAKMRYDGKLVVQDLDGNETEDVVNKIVSTLGMPVFIKASRSGSSVGCYKCTDENKLLELLLSAAKYDKHVVVEECIDCIELETGVLGNDDLIVSRVGQIMPHGEFYTFESKYEDEESKTCIPALVDDQIQEEIREYAYKAFKAIDGHGLSRIDFFYDKKKKCVYLNEINTLPGFTKISMYPQLLKDSGVSFTDLIDRLVALAYEK